MNPSPDQITIAITVYSRRQYIKEAISSALDQTIPVRVIVLEDCGPDPALQDFIKDEFGSRIEYIKNPKRRGIFGNLNACIEQCQTKWLSIVQDDDFLAPTFVAAMLRLAGHAPGLDFYFGQTIIVNQRSEPLPDNRCLQLKQPWVRLGLADVIYGSGLAFPGHLFRVSSARSLGGFRETSHFCGDWELWAKLIARNGAAQTSEVVAFFREHDAWDRGTNKILRSGKNIPVTIVQHKRVLALFPPATRPKFDRAGYLRHYAISVVFLLRYASSFSPRLLRYYSRMLLLSPAPHWRYAVFQQLARMGGPGFVKTASALWNRLRSSKRNSP
ncbi:MAG: glycosyltransferase family 2 protein [Limisphaerales bacterium]